MPTFQFHYFKVLSAAKLRRIGVFRIPQYLLPDVTTLIILL